jgi:hypothetical protein
MGYSYLEAPWIVSRSSYYATKPSESTDVTALDGYLVASGEQSFLELVSRGDQIEKACCCTPCFRIEEWDELHLPYFMKVELINTDLASLSSMIKDALKVFNNYLNVPARVIYLENDTFDIVGKNSGVELGSFGIRHWNDFSWVYGTGIAEPRTSQVLNMEK